MSYTHSHSVNVQPEATSRISMVALVLGILSVPGSILSWDTLPGGGFVWGLPVAIAAIVLGVAAVRSGAPGRWAAIVGVVLAASMIAMMALVTFVLSF